MYKTKFLSCFNRAEQLPDSDRDEPSRIQIHVRNAAFTFFDHGSASVLKGQVYLLLSFVLSSSKPICQQPNPGTQTGTITISSPRSPFLR